MSNSWDRCYYQHFTGYFGKPFDRETYRRDADSPPLQIITYDWAYPGYRLYASLGLTAYAAEVKDLAEVILLADGGGKVVPFLFVNALFFAIQQGIALSSKFAVGGVDRLAPPFAEQFDKAALYFTLVTPEDKFHPGFERVECAGDVGLVYQAIFISEAEHDFLRRSGGAAFEAKYRAQEPEADLCSLLRPSCV
jgi:hypothetical protein